MPIDPRKLQDFKWFAERFFCIRDRTAKIIPFKMNAMQEQLHSRLVGSDDVLKARKAGVSTYIVLRGLHRCLTRRNQRFTVLAHEHKASKEIFGIAKTAYDHMPAELKPKLELDNQQEIKFAGIGSRMDSHTAKNPEVGRGGTIDMLHCSEIAFWDYPEKTLTAISASLGEDVEVFRESTANGAGNYWHKEWVRGKNGLSGYRTHFFPWWVEPVYAVDEPDAAFDPLEFEDGRPKGKGDPNEEFEFSEKERKLGLSAPQARWRRRRIVKFKAKFPQEYAEDDITCFLVSGSSLFDALTLRDRIEVLLAEPNPVKYVRDDLGLKIYRQFTKRQWASAEFVVGADTSEGLQDEDDPSRHGDYCSAHVVERRTGIQVASVHGIWSPYEFAYVLEAVCRIFVTPQGIPLLGVEANEYGHAVLNELHHHIHYSNLYWRPASEDALKASPGRKLGWRTDGQSRPIMVTDLVQAVNENYLKVLDPDFLAECMTFVRNKRGRPEAQPGCHDDRVMSQAIAWQMHQRASGVPLMGTNLA